MVEFIRPQYSPIRKKYYGYYTEANNNNYYNNNYNLEYDNKNYMTSYNILIFIIIFIFSNTIIFILY
jgi:hypothetical protein